MKFTFLIAGSEMEMRAMMAEATLFFRKWRFSVSAKKSQVVACGKSETRGLKERSWEIGGQVIQDVRSYKYLGLLFEKNGLWTKMRESNIESTENAYIPLYQIGFGEAGLHIGQSAFLWQLYAKPRLLYGAEVWSTTSQDGWQDLENAQLQGARRIFGRRANHSTIGEALHRQAQYLHICQVLNLAHVTDNSWSSELCGLLTSLGMSPSVWTAAKVATLSRNEWERKVDTLVESADNRQLFSDFPRTHSGLHYATVKTSPGQEPYIWKFDRRSTTLKFALRSRSYGLQARLHGKRNPHNLKTCRLCFSDEDETKEHHLIRCSAFVGERVAFCDALTQHLQASFSVEYKDILLAPGPSQLAYLLGRSEPHWSPLVPTMIDMLIRPYLLALADKRKRLVADLDSR